MPYQVSRTDTGQFVITDPSTDTVIIDDDLAEGFAKLEQAVASKPALGPSSPPSVERSQAPGAFEFRGGPRYAGVLLAVVLPFAWLAVMYFALADLLAETALDRETAKDTEARIETLERELQGLRAEIAGAPRTAKTKPKRPKAKTDTQVEADADEPDDEPADEPVAEQPTAARNRTTQGSTAAAGPN